MHFMNDYDIEIAQHRFSEADTPNREKVADAVAKLAEWADNNSDGWHSWPKPCRAASKALDLIDPRTYADIEAFEETDATDAEVTAAFRPIKAFLTRQGVAHSEIFGA
jgi:hypothetical protein